jgi:hypothetical protein
VAQISSSMPAGASSARVLAASAAVGARKITRASRRPVSLFT